MLHCVVPGWRAAIAQPALRLSMHGILFFFSHIAHGQLNFFQAPPLGLHHRPAQAGDSGRRLTLAEG